MDLITKEGFEGLKIKLADYRGQITDITDRIREARSDSPELSENKAFIEASEDQARLDRKILDIEEKITTIKVIDINDYTEEMKDKVRFGCTVKILDCDTNEKYQYQIVGVDEVDTLNKECLRISYKSPVGFSLIGKSVGQEADVFTPSGERLFEVLEINYI
jgi:transcription elongation factor GreA